MTVEIKLSVDGMSCGGCANNVTKKIQGIEGVVSDSVKVDLKGKQAVFQAQDDAAALTASDILTKAGFPSKRI